MKLLRFDDVIINFDMIYSYRKDEDFAQRDGKTVKLYYIVFHSNDDTVYINFENKTARDKVFEDISFDCIDYTKDYKKKLEF